MTAVGKWRGQPAKERLHNPSDARRSGQPRKIPDTKAEVVVTRTLESTPANTPSGAPGPMAKASGLNQNATLRIRLAGAHPPSSLTAVHPRCAPAGKSSDSNPISKKCSNSPQIPSSRRKFVTWLACLPTRLSRPGRWCHVDEPPGERWATGRLPEGREAAGQRVRCRIWSAFSRCCLWSRINWNGAPTLCWKRHSPLARRSGHCLRKSHRPVPPAAAPSAVPAVSAAH